MVTYYAFPTSIQNSLVCTERLLAIITIFIILLDNVGNYIPKGVYMY